MVCLGGLAFYTKPGDGTNGTGNTVVRMVLDSQGYLGIRYKLDILGGNASSMFTGLNIKSNRNTANGIGQQLLFSLISGVTTYNQGSISTYRENNSANYATFISS